MTFDQIVMALSKKVQDLEQQIKSIRLSDQNRQNDQAISDYSPPLDRTPQIPGFKAPPFPDQLGQLDGDQTKDWSTEGGTEIDGKQFSLQSVPDAGAQNGLSQIYGFGAGALPSIESPSEKIFHNHTTEKDKALIRWWSATLGGWRTSFPELVEAYVLTGEPTYSEDDEELVFPQLKAMVIGIPGEVSEDVAIPWHNRLHAMDSVDDHNGSTYGDLVVGSTDGAWGRLGVNADPTINKYLKSAAAGGSPQWEQIAYADILGTPDVSSLHARLHAMDDAADHNGATIGDIVYGLAAVAPATTGAWAKLAANATTTKKFLRSYVEGGAAGAPSWEQVSHDDLSDIGTDDHHDQAHDIPDADGTNHKAGSPGALLRGKAGTGFWEELAANTATTSLFLKSRSAAAPAPGIPAWAGIVTADIGDLPDLSGLHARKHDLDGTDDHNGLASFTADNFLASNAGGLPKDSGSKASDFATSGHTHGQLHNRAHDMDSSPGDHAAGTPGALIFAAGTTGNWTELPANAADTALFLKSRSTVNGGIPAWTGVAYTDVSGTPDLSSLHARKHDIDGSDDHNGLDTFTEDNFVSSNASGLPKDSGKKASDFAESGHTHAQLHDRKHGIDDTDDHDGVADADEDNFMAFNASGLPKDSGSKAADFAASDHGHAQLHDRAHDMDSASDHNAGTPGALVRAALTTGAWEEVPVNTADEPKYLKQQNSGAPAWAGIAYADVSGTPTIPAAAPTHKLKWLSGGVLTDEQPTTPRGHYWLLGRILQPAQSTGNTPATVTAGEVWHINESTCLQFYAVAGWIDYDSPGTGVYFTDSEGDSVIVTIVDGLVTDPVAGSIFAVDTETGDTVELSIELDGTVTGFIGQVQVTDVDTGETVYLRITSSGHISQ